MTKVEAIKKLLSDNGGSATWKEIYNNIERYYPNAKHSKDWDAGLRGVLYREIKQNKNFKMIGLGICALIDYKEESIKEAKTERIHSIIEGICLDIGNLSKYETYTADPKQTYNNIPLYKIASLSEMPNFTYKNILDSVKNIDIIWFNKDKNNLCFPKRAIEVIDSLNTLEPALSRTYQLNSFNTDFYLVTKPDFVEKINKILDKALYKTIKNRYKVLDYEEIQKMHEAIFFTSKWNLLGV